MITLKTLPYSRNLLNPTLSSETIDFHYDKHHKGYVDKLNKLIIGTDFENKSLEDIVFTSHKNNNTAIYNNASQIWNHDFYWKSITPNGGMSISEKLLELLKDSFGDLATFNNKFIEAGATLFGSGWVWLVQDAKTLNLSITQTKNADSPLILYGQTPLLTIDVWEHAYYIDYRNNRLEYLRKVVELLNWEFAKTNANY
jgi:Fe-Mn family superoxide dismutase